MIDIDHLARTAAIGTSYSVDRQWLINYTCKVLEAAANAAHEAVIGDSFSQREEMADDAFNAVMNLRP